MTIYKAIYLTTNNLVCQKNFNTKAEAVAFIANFIWGRVLKIDDDRTVTDVTT